MSSRDIKYSKHALVRMKQRSISKADVEYVMDSGTKTRDPTWTPEEPVFRVTGRTSRGTRIRVVFLREMGQDLIITTIRL